MFSPTCPVMAMKANTALTTPGLALERNSMLVRRCVRGVAGAMMASVPVTRARQACDGRLAAVRQCHVAICYMPSRTQCILNCTWQSGSPRINHVPLSCAACSASLARAAHPKHTRRARAAVSWSRASDTTLRPCRVGHACRASAGGRTLPGNCVLKLPAAFLPGVLGGSVAGDLCRRSYTSNRGVLHALRAS